ncbi:MAG TPA: hypothetical protein VI758_01305 [Bacteroidota bacterium]
MSRLYKATLPLLSDPPFVRTIPAPQLHGGIGLKIRAAMFGRIPDRAL